MKPRTTLMLLSFWEVDNKSSSRFFYIGSLEKCVYLNLKSTHRYNPLPFLSEMNNSGSETPTCIHFLTNYDYRVRLCINKDLFCSVPYTIVC